MSTELAALTSAVNLLIRSQPSLAGYECGGRVYVSADGLFIEIRRPFIIEGETVPADMAERLPLNPDEVDILELIDTWQAARPN